MFKWLIFIIYYLAVSLLHLKFSMFLGNPLPDPFQGVRLATFADHFAVISLAGLLLIIVYQALNGLRRGVTFFFWGIWFLFVLLVDHFLIDRLEGGEVWRQVNVSIEARTCCGRQACLRGCFDQEHIREHIRFIQSVAKGPFVAGNVLDCC